MTPLDALRRAMTMLEQLRRGDCWCGADAGYPYHSASCLEVQAFVHDVKAQLPQAVSR